MDLERISKAFKGLSIQRPGLYRLFGGGFAQVYGPHHGNRTGPFGRNNDGHVGLNQWTLQRGYLTIAKEITPWLYGRYTADITQVGSTSVGGANGEASTGDWEFRTKYLICRTQATQSRQFPDPNAN